MKKSPVAVLVAMSVASSGCYTYYLRGREPATVTREIATDPEIDDAVEWTSFGASVESHPPQMGGLPADRNLRLLECNGEAFVGPVEGTVPGNVQSAKSPAPHSPRSARVPAVAVETLALQALPALRAGGGLLSLGCRFKQRGILITKRVHVGPTGSQSISSPIVRLPFAPTTDVAFTATLVAPAREVSVYRAPSRLNGMWMILGGLTIITAPVVAFVPGSSDGTNPHQHLGAGAVVGAVGLAMFLGGLYGFSASGHPKELE